VVAKHDAEGMSLVARNHSEVRTYVYHMGPVGTVWGA